MSTTITHAELVGRGARWLYRSYGCGVVLTENTSVSGETPDIIGWKATGRSVLVEVKVSRSDYLADSKKPHRVNPLIALGAERYYMVPKGLIKPEELPADWGLIEATAARFKIVVPARPRKDLRSDVAKSYETRMLIRALEHVSLRLNGAPMWEWLEYKNREVTASQMQTFTGKEDHELHILALRGFLPVVDPSDLPVDEASGEPWCPRHEMLFHECACPSRFKGHTLEFEEHNGRLFSRFAPQPPYHPDDPIGWLLNFRSEKVA